MKRRQYLSEKRRTEMKQIREAIDRTNQCMNRLDRLYYMAARKLGVKDNSLLLYYVLSDEKAHSQKKSVAGYAGSCS